MTTMLAHPLIDLIELGRHRKSAAGRPFATAIVLMADNVIHRYMNETELLGIRTCLRHQLRVLSWRSYAWGIPLGRYSFSNTTFELEGRTYILPNSLIASVLKYRESLDERDTALRQVIFSELVTGLEWACWSSQFESEIETSQGAKLIPAQELNAYVSWTSTTRREACDS